MFAEREFDESQIAGLFKEVKYYITGNISENVQKALAAGEAKKTAYLSGINTHCIVGYDPDMNEVSEATDMLDVPSVDQDWVIASAQAKQILPIKLSPERATSKASTVDSSESHLFRSVLCQLLLFASSQLTSDVARSRSNHSVWPKSH